MRVQLRNLGIVGYNSGWSFYSYRTTDDYEALANPAYWNDAIDILKLGDEIHVHHTFGANSIWCVVAVGDAVRLACMLYCNHFTAGDRAWQQPLP